MLWLKRAVLSYLGFELSNDHLHPAPYVLVKCDVKIWTDGTMTLNGTNGQAVVDLHMGDEIRFTIKAPNTDLEPITDSYRTTPLEVDPA